MEQYTHCFGLVFQQMICRTFVYFFRNLSCIIIVPYGCITGAPLRNRMSCSVTGDQLCNQVGWPSVRSMHITVIALVSCIFTHLRLIEVSLYTLLHKLACNIANYCMSGYGIFSSTLFAIKLDVTKIYWVKWAATLTKQLPMLERCRESFREEPTRWSCTNKYI